MMQNPTRITQRTYRAVFPSGAPESYEETETDARTSVRVVENSKGEMRVGEVHVFHADPMEAMRQAVATMFAGRALIQEQATAQMDAQLRASVERKP